MSTGVINVNVLDIMLVIAKIMPVAPNVMEIMKRIPVVIPKNLHQNVPIVLGQINPLMFIVLMILFAHVIL